MNKPAQKSQPCDKLVSDHTGFYFWACDRPAKWVWRDSSGVLVYRCGLHAKRRPPDAEQVKK